MSEPSEWAMEKARVVYDVLETTRECFVGTAAERLDIAALARALMEAEARGRRRGPMLCTSCGTVCSTDECDCTRMGMERLSMRVNYIAHLHNELDLADEKLARAVEALKPFARAGKLFPPLKDGEFDMCIYAPVAGPEYKIAAEDLRRARAVYEGEK